MKKDDKIEFNTKPYDIFQIPSSIPDYIEDSAILNQNIKAPLQKENKDQGKSVKGIRGTENSLVYYNKDDNNNRKKSVYHNNFNRLKRRFNRIPIE